MKTFLLQSAAFATILLAAGCSGSSNSNDQVAAANASDDNLAFNEATPSENMSAPTVTPPPAAPAGSSSQDAAPLAQAGQIASQIDSAPDVERVPFEGGWAWRRRGQILRTESRDGGRIAYFRPGESAPFFVQQGDRSFAYANGHARRAYDRGGRAAPVPPDRRSDADRLAEQSRHEHSAAEHAPAAPHGSDGGRQDQHAGPSSDRHGGGNDANAGNGSADNGQDRSARHDGRRDRRSSDAQANRTGR